MASFKSAVGINGHEGFSISGDFIGTFDDLIKEMPDICNKALNTGAYIIKDSIKTVFVQKMPAAGRPFKVPATTKGGYVISRSDMLVDAIMQSKAKTTHATISVRGNEEGSPLFIARMYDGMTKDRYAKTYKGKPLKKKRYVGRVGGVNYFNPGIQSGENEAYNAMQSIFEKYVENTING